MEELTIDQVQAELKRGIDFYRELDGQILAFLTRLAELLEEDHELPPLKKPFAKNARRASVVQTYLLLLKPTGAEVEAEEDGDDEEAEDAEEGEEAVDHAELSFAPDAKLPYVLVQLTGKPSQKAQGQASPPYVQYGWINVTGRKDGKELTEPTIVMRGGYYSSLFRNRVCNPARKPPYVHKTKKGGATLKFEEGQAYVLPLGAIRKESDIEELAKKITTAVES